MISLSDTELDLLRIVVKQPVPAWAVRHFKEESAAAWQRLIDLGYVEETPNKQEWISTMPGRVYLHTHDLRQKWDARYIVPAAEPMFKVGDRVRHAYCTPATVVSLEGDRVYVKKDFDTNISDWPLQGLKHYYDQPQPE